MPTVPALPDPPATLDTLRAVSAATWADVLAGPPTRAAAWLTAGARLGSAQAQAVLGQWLLDGTGVQANAVEAFMWFVKAADQGHAMAMNMAGRCLENGWGTRVDRFAATTWYRKAALTGLDAAMYNYANQLAEGVSVPQDHPSALQWYRLAAEQKHAKSMTRIGRYYEQGLVVDQDLDAAFLCYGQAAEAGDFRGQFRYAGMLAAQGRMTDALQWLRKVPLTATPAYLAKAGTLLAGSPHEEFRVIGRQMLDGAAQKGTTGTAACPEPGAGSMMAGPASAPTTEP